MGKKVCEEVKKCPSGVIASTGLGGLHDLLEAYRLAGDEEVEIKISIKGKDETNSYSFVVANIAEVVEMLRLTTGK